MYYDVDYEDMILARQEAMEIWEDDPDAEYLNGWDPFSGAYIDEGGDTYGW